MSARPAVSVVMPFGGSPQQARCAVASLASLAIAAEDELILADNTGVAPPATDTVRVIGAAGERSAAHARNAGAAAIGPASEWILFLDADTVAPPDLIDRYFATSPAADVGAVAGAVVAAGPPPGAGIAARYGAHKNFLDAGAHLAHPFMARAAAANLLVRRTAFAAVGGFFEGLRAAEDTDFSWRLQLAGWRLTGCPGAVVEHRYRDSVGALRRQWRSYAAGRAWLSRRYLGFAPRPAIARAAARIVDRHRRSTNTDQPSADPRRPAAPPPRRDRALFVALDLLLGVEELIGFAQSNRPGGCAATSVASATRVLVADRFPAAGITAEPGIRVEAVARPDLAQPLPAGVDVSYREDDGFGDHAAALLALAARAPAPTLAALAADPRTTIELAPAARRLLGNGGELCAAEPTRESEVARLAALAGRTR